MSQKIESDKLDIQIKLLEKYVKENKIEDFSVLSFLFDMKEMSNDLRSAYLYKRLQKQYRKHKDLKKVEKYYSKTVKVLRIAQKYIITNDDEFLDNIIKNINNTVIENYKKAYTLFEMEFSV